MLAQMIGIIVHSQTQDAQTFPRTLFLRCTIPTPSSQTMRYCMYRPSIGNARSQLYPSIPPCSLSETTRAEKKRLAALRIQKEEWHSQTPVFSEILARDRILCEHEMRLALLPTMAELVRNPSKARLFSARILKNIFSMRLFPIPEKKKKTCGGRSENQHDQFRVLANAVTMVWQIP